MMRADPDIIMVGEIRDKETAQIAVEASLTGHLVLCTLHTNDAPTAITRLTEMGIEPFLVGSAIDAVVAQRLARRLCDECKRRVMLPAEVLRQNGFNVGLDLECYEPVGCARCGGTGYKGRIGLYEVMTISETIRNMAVARETADAIAHEAVREGMMRLREDGLEKVRRGRDLHRGDRPRRRLQVARLISAAHHISVDAPRLALCRRQPHALRERLHAHRDPRGHRGHRHPRPRSPSRSSLGQAGPRRRTRAAKSLVRSGVDRHRGPRGRRGHLRRRRRADLDRGGPRARRRATGRIDDRAARAMSSPSDLGRRARWFTIARHRRAGARSQRTLHRASGGCRDGTW